MTRSFSTPLTRPLRRIGRCAKSACTSACALPVPELAAKERPDYKQNRKEIHAQLEREAADLGLRAPQVVFAGMVPPQQVAEWYQLGDLFVSASSSETQGLTYVEALAAGVPALCRADPCLSGVIRDGENGWQFRDFSDFMSKLETFRAHPELRRALSEQAAASARDYSAEEFARRAEAIYLAQIARRSGREEVSA